MAKAKKPVNSRQKGKRAERQACEFLRRLGFTANRTAQNRGKTGECGDIEVKELPSIHFEVKHRQGIDLGTNELTKACMQAEKEGGLKTPAVLWKRNGTDWRMTVRMIDYLAGAVYRCTLDRIGDIEAYLKARATVSEVVGGEKENGT